MAGSGSNPGGRRAATTVAVALAALAGTLLWAGARRGGGADADAPFHLLDAPVEAARDSFRGDDGGVPVLCYHYFRPAWSAGYTARVLGAVVLNLPTLGVREFWTTPIGEFERHLRLLHERGTRFVTLDEVAAAARRGVPLPSPAIVITIDDADESVYTLAWPVLKRYGARAHLFVPTAHVGREWSGLRVCSWEQLREMHASGAIVVESHTHDLHWKVPAGRVHEPVFLRPARLGAAGGAAGATAAPEADAAVASPTLRAALAGVYAPVARDLLASRAAIADAIGRAPRYLAWPYGFATTALDSVAGACGFAGSVSLKPAPWRTGGPAWHVGRFAVTAKTTPATLLDLLPGAPASPLAAARP